MATAYVTYGLRVSMDQALRVEVFKKELEEKQKRTISTNEILRLLIDIGLSASEKKKGS